MKKIVVILVLCVAAFGAAHYFSAGGKRDAARSQPLPHSGKKGEGKKMDRPDKFLQFHQGIRTRDGETGPAYRSHYKWNELRALSDNEFARKRRSGRSKSSGIMEWKERGPGNVPGRTRALLNIPGDPAGNTWLAGAATGGIWRTTNGGVDWTEVSAGFPALPISTFGANNNATVIYAGTGEFVSSFYSAIGNGIFRSTDKGLTWTQIPATDNDPDFSIITRLIVNPANPDIVVATTVPHNTAADNTSAIMRTNDGGATWTKVLEVTGFLEQIIATPGNFSIQYATQNGVGVWKSVNGGLTWNLSNQGMRPGGRIELSVSRTAPDRIFASAEGSLSGTNSDLYYSPDRGVTWSLVDVRYQDDPIDFFEGQGFYDNTIMCDPFNADKVYFGGVSLFCSTLGTGSSPVSIYHIEESGTETFLFLQRFSNVDHDRGRLLVGDFDDQKTVEIRFGAGQSQKAHRFTVPPGATSNVAAGNYSFAGYIDVPFEVWDVSSNRQLMVSFRDQNRNGKFDLISAEDEPAREYVFINNVSYNATAPSPHMDQAGGQEHRLMYNFFPALAAGAVWDPLSLPDAELVIRHEEIPLLNATTVIVADGRGSFDDKNSADQVNLDRGVHPDHHFMVPIISSETQKTFRILLANDGGVFVSKVSANPGTTEGDWQFRGFGLNTSQFYGADKKPGAQQYIGGMQDNGTRLSLPEEPASALTDYLYAIGGDGGDMEQQGPEKTARNGLQRADIPLRG